jgi:hypothetical protein
MIVTIHQPEHLPWLGFFDKMRQADKFVLLDTTQFAKDDFQNRNRIKTAKGPTWLTVPVYKKSKSHQLIADTEICNDRNWRQRSWSLIEQNYREASFYSEHADFFKQLYARTWTRLTDLNLEIIGYLREQLGLHTELILASELGVYEQGGTQVNLTICRELGAEVYLSGSHGRNYLDQDLFREDGIEVTYQDFKHPEYPQLWGPFQSHMSTLDLLFNCGNESLQIISTANSEAAIAGVVA